MTLEEFNSKYVYVTDIEKFHTSLDVWEVLGVDGFSGDCESYALTLKKKVDGFADWELWYCRLNDGGGHCILYKNGDVIDCNVKKVVSLEDYSKMYKVTEFKKYNWFVVFSKILFSNAYLFYKKIRGI